MAFKASEFAPLLFVNIIVTEFLIKFIMHLMTPLPKAAPTTITAPMDHIELIKSMAAYFAAQTIQFTPANFA